MRIQTFTFLALLAAAAPVPRAMAQRVPVRTLTRPDAEHGEPFTVISGIRELSDRRVLAIDVVERSFVVIDLAAGKRAAVARVGSGPSEYLIPSRLFAVGADTTILVDVQLSRYLPILPGGKVGEVYFLEDGAGGRVSGSADFADAHGAFYLLSSRYADRRSGGGLPGEVDQVLVRRDRSGRHVDTMAVLAVPAGRLEGTRTLTGNRVFGYNSRPLAKEDAVAVGTDGRVAVARGSDYHVEWILPDRRVVKGPPTTFTPIPIDQSERDAFVRQQTRPGRIVSFRVGGDAPPPATGSGGAPRAAGGGSVAMRGNPFDGMEVVWPATMPAFVARAARVANDGRLWVLRTRPASDPNPSYDVFDARGVVVERVVTPPNTRLVGFGNGTVYLSRKDDDDFQYLQRYKFP